MCLWQWNSKPLNICLVCGFNPEHDLFRDSVGCEWGLWLTLIESEQIVIVYFWDISVSHPYFKVNLGKKNKIKYCTNTPSPDSDSSIKPQSSWFQHISHHLTYKKWISVKMEVWRKGLNPDRTLLNPSLDPARRWDVRCVCVHALLPTCCIREGKVRRLLTTHEYRWAARCDVAWGSWRGSAEN